MSERVPVAVPVHELQDVRHVRWRPRWRRSWLGHWLRGCSDCWLGRLLNCSSCSKLPSLPLLSLQLACICRCPLLWRVRRSSSLALLLRRLRRRCGCFLEQDGLPSDRSLLQLPVELVDVLQLLVLLRCWRTTAPAAPSDLSPTSAARSRRRRVESGVAQPCVIGVVISCALLASLRILAVVSRLICALWRHATEPHSLGGGRDAMTVCIV